ncbi:MAG: hypothetical protein RM022_032890 [Nostoc sp. EfeVER01]|uniref:hypothetical protein n=1 Tax=unclassified Nostoc TaxID=2593658 RepID=UPI002AD39708|nr:MULTISPECIES: hypothetical protein [unclassified Nostoc]MDZ7944042.1 hypothetical protein [Nostoc sp. EfeVER01]MDZ7993951.1 hypothetical protein [Nostoc sp. EspVER01]
METKAERHHVQKIYTSDPLADFLFEKLLYNFNINPFKITILSAIVMVTIYIIAATLSNSFVSSDKGKGLLADLNSWIWILIYNPIVLGFYYWLSTNNLLGRLSSLFYMSNMIDNQYYGEVDDLLRLYRHPLPRFIAISVSITYGILFFCSRDNLPGWTGTTLIPTISSSFIGVIVMYAIIMEANILIINLRGIRKFVQSKEININPWHPDKCGGFKIISEYLITVTYLVGLIWFMAFLSIYQFYQENLIEQFGYMLLIIPVLILFSSTCFMWTVYAVHKEMEKSKQRFLEPFAQQLNKYYDKMNNLMISELYKTKNDNEVCELRKFIQKEMNIILKLDSSYKSMINSYPIWPFDMSTIKVWLVTIIIPLLIPIISAFSKIIVEMIK